jgi:hypothetical protein
MVQVAQQSLIRLVASNELSHIDIFVDCSAFQSPRFPDL